VAAAAFINFIYVYMLRLNINIVIVAMINYTAIPHANATAVTVEECGHLSVSDNDQPPSDDDNLPVY
jgi:ACS family sodium-dependent inorganic phosphate cotransporter-like MFS transporter 5